MHHHYILTLVIDQALVAFAITEGVLIGDASGPKECITTFERPVSFWLALGLSFSLSFWLTLCPSFWRSCWPSFWCSLLTLLLVLLFAFLFAFLSAFVPAITRGTGRKKCLEYIHMDGYINHAFS